MSYEPELEAAFTRANATIARMWEHYKVSAPDAYPMMDLVMLAAVAAATVAHNTHDPLHKVLRDIGELAGNIEIKDEH